jgi:hypothetical protein
MKEAEITMMKDNMMRDALMSGFEKQFYKINAKRRRTVIFI